MKLYPKARPVQINKLKLGGYDILNTYDLLSHFYVSEIIDLGRKFLAWIARNPELASYVDKVEANIKAYESTKDKEAVGIGLLCTFFHDKLMRKECGSFIRDLVGLNNDHIVVSFLECVRPNIDTAMLVFDLNLDYEILRPWLQRCEKCFENDTDIKGKDIADFYHKCGHLNTIDDKDYDYYIRKAREKWNEESKNVVLEGEFAPELHINIGNGEMILMKKVVSAAEIFYIAHQPIIGNVASVMLGGKWTNAYKTNIGCFSIDQCTVMLNYLNRHNSQCSFRTVQWSIPSASLWRESYEINAISVDYMDNKIGEWCYDQERGRYVSVNNRGKFAFELEAPFLFRYLCFRPVLKIVSNKL